MPQRTFSALDIIDFDEIITQNYNDNGNEVDWVISGNAFNNILAQVTYGATVSSVSQQFYGTSVQVDVTGNWNFATFPALPTNALITKIKLRIATSLNASAQISTPDDFGAVVEAGFGISVSANTGIYSPHVASISGYNLKASSPYAVLVTGSQVTSLAASERIYEVPIDFLIPIPYAEFIASFQSTAFTIQASLFASAGQDQEGNEISLSGTAQVTSYEIIIDYDLGSVEVWGPEIVDAEIPIKVGSPIRILDTTGEAGLGNIIAITFTYGAGIVCTVNQIDFTFQSPEELIFYAPFCLGSFEGEVTVAAIGDGVMFSGSVPLGILIVFFEDASGIYRIVKGKTTDTVYNPERDGTTEEIKIPNPFGATGFVDG